MHTKEKCADTGEKTLDVPPSARTVLSMGSASWALSEALLSCCLYSYVLASLF